MRYKAEKLATVLDEMLPLMHSHWREIGHYQDFTLRPEILTYLRMDEEGTLKVFTARSLDNILVGYAVFFVRANMHYRDSLQAVQDVLFVSREYRGMNGAFIEWCDEQLRAMGVQLVSHHVKLTHDWSKVLKRLDYEPIETIYARRLDKDGPKS